MAEAPEIVTMPDKEEGPERHGPCNLVTADEYTESLDEVMLHFKESVMEDRKDALLVTVNALKCKMTLLFELCVPLMLTSLFIQSKTPDACHCARASRKEWSWRQIQMRTSHLGGRWLERSHRQVVSASGEQHHFTLQQLVRGPCTYVNSATNLSLIGKIIDVKTFCMILKASIHLMVQLLIPEHFS